IFEPFIGDSTAVSPTAAETILSASRLENIARTESDWAMNQGRTAIGDAAGDYVVGYEYSAILDERTTEICQTADGLMLKKEAWQTSALLPPNHYQCRSTIIYITTDDLPVKWSTEAQINRAVSLIQEGFS